MSKKKVIIIGAGLAGLSAGCYLQMNGFETEIYEAGATPGGLITSWKRKGYTIDGCIHGLLGSSASHPLYHIWNELIDMSKLEFFDSETKFVIITKNKRKFLQYSDLNRLEKYMKDISPEDKPVIEEFINDVRKLQGSQAYEMTIKKPREFFNVFDYLKMIRFFPMLRLMKKWLKMSAEEFSKKFKNPFLKEVTKNFLSPVLFEMFVLSEMDLKRSGYPIGGSLNFSRLFERKYLETGGKILYNSKVSRIRTNADKNGKIRRVTGIKLENGDIHSADIVISAMDGKTTIFNLLEGKFVNDKIINIYKTKELNPSNVSLSIGVSKTYDNEEGTLIINLKTPFILPDGTEYDYLKVRIFNFDPTLAPEGKTLISVPLDTMNFKFWSDLRSDQIEQYRKIKKEIAQKLIDILDEYLNDLKQNVEMIDVATPATYYRYTYNWNGSIQGWSNGNIFENKPIKKQLPNLKNFYMIGQWVEPGGGVPTVFMSGRNVAQIICKQEKIAFTTL
jgi:phytoene dehydrogenase-like protein